MIKYSPIPNTRLTQISPHISTVLSKQFRTARYKAGKVGAAKKASTKQALAVFPAAFISIQK